MASTSESSGWQNDPPVPLVGYLSRKALPIKRNDAEPLTREDVQYDLLHHIFCDTQAVFTGQTPGSSSKVNFCDLYVNALYHSSKCSKVLKDKMIETPAFSVELAKISLLTNVGRINTTMACTSETSFFPLGRPNQLKTDGNAQDAPRIKNCLKAALLPSELKSMPPSTPEEILEKAISSADRAKAFLWLMFHYLEGPDQPNPYDDDYSRQNPGKVPRLRRLSDAEMAAENVDTVEEIEWGKAMSAQRNLFLKRLVTSQGKRKEGKEWTSYIVGTTGRPRLARPPGDGAREKPYIHYMPPQRLGLAPNPSEPRAGGSGAHGLQRSMLDRELHVALLESHLV
ncbi:hypothetical protein EDC04DRAFT_2598969 [Pisolithus marmoratus]|nr:hypothetical protein EDC04DRAFT_2598969 [Pisolithus marmoratus]